MIIAYSTWRPGPQQLAGVNGVMRYLSHDAAKDVTAAELGQLHGEHVGTGLFFEDSAGRALGGSVAGAADGAFCRARLAELGVPASRPVYATVDFDVSDYSPSTSNPRAKLGPVGDYLEAFRAAVHPHPIGAYGGYWLVSRAADAGLAWWLAQTAAWSGGQIDHRVALYQPGVQLGGGQADLWLAGLRDWGQFRKHCDYLTGPAA